LTAAACAWQVIGRNGANFTRDSSLAHANLASLYLKLCPNHLFQLQVWTDVENKLADFGQLPPSQKAAFSARLRLRPPHASVSLGQPALGPHWPAISGLFST